ncbi:PREDICTED: structural maintenance of chromosomes flexible hinge domain-containing protein 1-like, partial [Cyprinodon variegatus]|uniref:structural maintenance of chromosomes flexible hinge domain-containing protein 1-like n=1 Tax=Cyprinodon variegatus TaxID=28743 RepID=UPI0007428D5E
PCPDEPARLKAILPKNTMKLGETLDETIELELVDQYDNVTKRLTAAAAKSMTVEAEGLDQSNIQFLWQSDGIKVKSFLQTVSAGQESSSSVAVTGVCFKSGPLGPRELCFSYNNYTECVIIKVAAGIPAKLKLLSGPELPLQVLNCQGIPTPFTVQLCDKWENPSQDKNLTIEITTTSETLKLTHESQPMDSEGKVCFTINNLKGSKGSYVLELKGSLNGKSIPGPSVKLILLADPNKPMNLSVKYDTNARFPAGDFSVTVLSEEGSQIQTFKPADLSMSLWEKGSATQPETDIMPKCGKPIKDEENHCYRFRGKAIPKHAGEYTVEFALQSNKTEDQLRTQINIKVVANEPIKLEPECQLETPAVFNCRDISNRILVENVTLKIMDQHGNPAGQDLNGKVFISMKCPDGEIPRSLPLFKDKNSHVQISLKEGTANIDSLAISENSPGENGRRYILLFRPEVTMPPTSLSPFELPFYFYNDAENHQKRCELLKRKDRLNEVKDTTEKEISFRNGLKHKGLKIEHQLSIKDIAEHLKQKNVEVENIEKSIRRVCSIPNQFSGPDILGMVGHLAFVADDDAARVISWHLQGDMDCVITTTTPAAQKLHQKTKGNQQVMPLDSILLHQGSRPLPHIKYGRELFRPTGNPVFAKDLLIYPYKESCDPDKLTKVFKNLLGDTILMDDLNSATNYRKEVVEKGIFCPTILTRKGDRVSGRGKFGGKNNRAPSIDQLKVFGAPLPPHYYTLKDQIDALREYQALVEKKEEAEKELNDHKNPYQ